MPPFSSASIAEALGSPRAFSNLSQKFARRHATQLLRRLQALVDVLGTDHDLSTLLLLVSPKFRAMWALHPDASRNLLHEKPGSPNMVASLIGALKDLVTLPNSKE